MSEAHFQGRFIQLSDGADDVEGLVGSGNPLPVTTPASSPSTVIQEKVSSVTESVVGVTTGDAEILASNVSRKGGYILNLSDEVVWVSFGNAAAVNTTIPIKKSYGWLDFMCGRFGPVYTGAVNGIHGGSGTKNVFILEA